MAVIGNMLVRYEEGNVRAAVAPDVFVIFGVESKASDFVLEVALESARREDVGRKREIYTRIGVTEHWRFDPTPNSRR